MARDKLHKTCIDCGLKKPLSAFLQINGPLGTTYGNVCSTCRGSSAGKKIIVPQAEDETSSSSTGLKIDAKSKVQAEQNQREHVEKAKEAQLNDLEKRLDEIDKKEEKKEFKESETRKHRESFLDRKKQDSFLSFQSKKDPTRPAVPGADKEFTEKQSAIKNAEQHAQATTLEHRKTTEDFSVQVLDQHTTQVSRDNPFYKAWEELMGDSAAIKNVRRQFLGGKSATHPAGTPENTAKDAKEQLKDYIKETWPTPPTGGRGRR